MRRIITIALTGLIALIITIPIGHAVKSMPIAVGLDTDFSARSIESIISTQEETPNAFTENNGNEKELGKPYNLVINGHHGNPAQKTKDNNFYESRVALQEEHAGAFLVDEALQKNYRRVALALEKTGWGKSNEKAMKNALRIQGMEPVGISWFNWENR